MEIRKLATASEYLEAERLQRTVWNFPEREIIPLNELVVMQKHGGHVFGAFDGKVMAAFCFGMPAYRDGKAYHYSRMLGVLPGRQDSGIGYAMKLKQREYVLKQGLDLVVWTFDPLQSRNAYLNIEKLGCVIREYLVNLYPTSGSKFNEGMESDRFTAEWWIASRRVRDSIAGKRRNHALEECVPAIRTVVTDGGWREPVDVEIRSRQRRLSIEIPDDIDALKKDDLALAQRWREATRKAFLAAFKKGYVAHGFVGIPEVGRRRSFYLLEKEYRVR
ncbi:MAG TPA: acetyltransferase [Planctomycetota bacterium]|nr:acetyltransferase [Planctomycetota bacterium]